MNGWKQIEHRSRYSYWDLVSDVGGFYTGCFLFCSVFMSSYASLSFKVDYVNGTYVEVASDRRVR